MTNDTYIKTGIGALGTAGTSILGQANLVASLIVAGLTAAYLCIQIAKALKPSA